VLTVGRRQSVRTIIFDGYELIQLVFAETFGAQLKETKAKSEKDDQGEGDNQYASGGTYAATDK
jgi:hypothetical protein